MRMSKPLTTLAFAIASSALAAQGQTALVTIARTGPSSLAYAQAYFQDIAPLGDVDQDGWPDWVWSGLENVLVYSGQTGQVLHAFADGASVVPSEEGAFSSAGVGDVNGDGFADIAVGAGADSTTGVRCGVVRIYSGASGAVITSWTGPEGHATGLQVEAAGDLDLDGFNDLIVASPLASSASESAVEPFAWALSSNPGSPAVLHEIESAGAVGVRVGGVGDVDADGAADFAVKFTYGNAKFDTLAVHDGQNGGAIFDVVAGKGYHAGWYFGGATDLDSDGYDDIFVASPGASFHPDFWSGRFEIISGRMGETLASRDGSDPYGTMGWRARAAGDIDRDGGCDFIVTDPDCTTQSGWRAGRVHVYVDACSRRLATSLDGALPYAATGICAAALGDINGDGAADVGVLDPYSTTSQGIGVVTIYSLASVAAEPRGFVPGSRLLGSVAAAGEISEATFHALPGAKIELIAIVSTGATARLQVVDPMGTVAGSWIVKKGKTTKSLTLDRSGAYTLRVSHESGSGEYEIRTKVKWPKKMNGGSSLCFAKSGAIKKKIHGVAGSIIALEVVGKQNIPDSPTVTLIHESGLTIDLEPFTYLFGGELGTDPFPLPLDGEYVLSVPPANGDAPSKASITVYSDKPFGSELLRID